MKKAGPLLILEGEPLYRQEAAVGMFQVMFPYHTMSAPMKKWVPVNYGEIWLFYRKGYFLVGYYEKNLEKVANAVLELCKDGFPEEWEKEWKRIEADITKAAHKVAETDLASVSDAELAALYEELYAIDIEMWGLSIFIDAFDPGYDRAAMDRIAAVHGLSEDEIHALSTPLEPSFVTAWELAVEKFANGELSKDDLKRDFFWYGVSYSEVVEVDDAFVENAVEKRHPVSFESPAEAEKAALAARGLSENPLEVFRTLTRWRDERKKLNYIGLYGLVKVAREMLRRRGFDLSYANAFLPEQIPHLMDGTFTPEELPRQYEEGTFIHLADDGEYRFSFGAEAAERWAEVEAAFTKLAAAEGATEAKGTIASKGKAEGMARIVMDFNGPEAKDFRKGDILMTSMTRPEFLPLMKLAAAIVTNEGGITSHAAIVSRELKIPCIIGTKNATKIFKDGDMVEVDANAGIVRKV